VEQGEGIFASSLQDRLTIRRAARSLLRLNKGPYHRTGNGKSLVNDGENSDRMKKRSGRDGTGGVPAQSRAEWYVHRGFLSFCPRYPNGTLNPLLPEIFSYLTAFFIIGNGPLCYISQMLL